MAEADADTTARLLALYLARDPALAEALEASGLTQS